MQITEGGKMKRRREGERERERRRRSRRRGVEEPADLLYLFPNEATTRRRLTDVADADAQVMGAVSRVREGGVESGVEHGEHTSD